jgi:hypothetical protein
MLHMDADKIVSDSFYERRQIPAIMAEGVAPKKNAS